MVCLKTRGPRGIDRLNQVFLMKNNAQQWTMHGMYTQICDKHAKTHGTNSIQTESPPAVLCQRLHATLTIVLGANIDYNTHKTYTLCKNIVNPQKI